MLKHADFLVEIGTEELPPKALQSMERAFSGSIAAGIDAAALTSGPRKSFSTPRRLAVLIQDLQTHQAPQVVEKRGPSIKVAFSDRDQPTPAGLAFARNCGVAINKLDRLKTEKGEWLLYRAEEPGAAAAELLPDIVRSALRALPIPKRMRWGSSDAEFVRPVHWVLMKLGNTVIESEILGLRAGTLTYGHRFHAPGPIMVEAPGDYADLLSGKGKIVPDFEKRRELIEELAHDAARTLGARAILDPPVLDEVTALVEWPVAITGNFDADYLRLPDEVLVATLQNHQRYFPVRSEAKKLVPAFIAISNLDSEDPDQVRRGNERVVGPRLADAAFFWDQDRRSSLDSRRDSLRQVIFQKELGNLGDKADRVAMLAVNLAGETGRDEAIAGRAANLAKTDLLTQMVGEFPELQGRMGYYYALHDGESDAVAIAIREQYLPKHAGGELPTSPAGQILAIADRLDTLAGIFTIGKRPSGNKDPFGLRRGAMGLARILIEQEIELDLPACIARALDAQPVQNANAADLVAEIYTFIVDRMKAYYLDGLAPGLEKGAVTPEVFESVRVRSPASPLDFHQRVSAVCRFMRLDAAESLAMANKRIANILRSADDEAVSEIDVKLFEADAEERLHAAVADITARHRAALKKRDYRAVLEGLAALKNPVDEYFDTVLVMAEEADKRCNRLGTLSQLRQLFLDVADISCIPT